MHETNNKTIAIWIPGYSYTGMSNIIIDYKNKNNFSLMQITIKMTNNPNIVKLLKIQNTSLIIKWNRKAFWTMVTTKKCTLLENTVAPALQHITKIHYKRSGSIRRTIKTVMTQSGNVNVQSNIKRNQIERRSPGQVLK